jgi:hypothetical protein
MVRGPHREARLAPHQNSQQPMYRAQGPTRRMLRRERRNL